MTAFCDLPPADHDRGMAFWAAVSGYEPSPSRGDHGEFATLVPPAGTPYLRTQRIGPGAAGVHLDLHVEDPLEAAFLAVGLGALEIARPGYVVLASPGGLPFCLVHADPGPPERPPAATWPGGGVSQVDQVSIDIPPAAYDVESAFWAGLTGWEPAPSRLYAELVFLVSPPTLPLRLLLQRLESPQDRVTAHLDVACSDRAAETERHRALGGSVVRHTERWTTLTDPAGTAYCLTDRAPYSASVPP